MISFFLSSVFSLVVLWKAIRYYLLWTTTANLDLPLLGRSRSVKIPGTAVICGGSIGGLLAARVCSDHFTDVIVIEPEAWLASPDGSVPQSWTQVGKRSRVVQYDSSHVTMRFLYIGLRFLFPNLDAECAESGIPVAPADFKTHFFGIPYLAPFDSHGRLPNTIFASRKALETLVRRLTLGNAAIKQVVGTVAGMDVSHDGYVRSVSLRKSDGTAETIAAAFVVDCTGPSCAGLKWLKRATGKDYTKHRISFDPKMYYTSTHFTISSELAARLPIPGGWDGMSGGHIHVLMPAGQDNFLSVAKIEHNQVVICCGGWGWDRAVCTVEDIKSFALAIPTRAPIYEWFLEFLDMLKAVDETRTYSVVRVREFGDMRPIRP